MRLAGKTKRRLVDEINITPLTDVFLVLLIIMMVVAPMMKMTRMDIRTPEVDSGGELDASKLVVEVTKEGVYFVGGTQTAEADLSSAFKTKAKEPPDDRGLIIQGDREALSKYAIAIFKAAKEAEYKKVTLAVATKSISTTTDGKEPDQPITPLIKPLDPPSP